MLKSARSQLAPPTPHPRLRLQATPVLRCAESRCRCSAGTVVGVQEPPSRRPKGTFMNAGSAVPLASAAQARAIHQLPFGHAVSLCFCRPVIPSSCQIVLTRHPKTVEQVVNTSS